MFDSESRMKGLGMDQRNEEKSMQSGEIMENQGFGMHSSMRTRRRCARVEYEVAW